MSLDYNGAELRTVLALGDEPQPDWDIHQWNAKNVFGGVLSREESKEKFFAWLYNPESDAISSDLYNRDKILSNYYLDGRIQTPAGRSIAVEQRKAFNYLIQSTTADMVLRQLIKVYEALKGHKSYVAFAIHDSLVIDLAKEDKHLLKNIFNVFSKTDLGEFLISVKAGKNFGQMREIKWT